MSRSARARRRPRSSAGAGRCAPASSRSWQSRHRARTPTPSPSRRTTRPRARCPRLGGAIMTLFTNTVTLRGFLGKNAEAPPSDGITEDAYAILLLATVSGRWDLSTNEWTPRTDSHRIICPGPFFCGMVRGMRRGDYLEVEGELRGKDQMPTAVAAGEFHR